MKLSIITINYNNKAGLEKTIESVMSQTWRDFEWIIIDGGSTDGSKEVIEELAKNPNANISYWCSEPDKGVYNALNKGIVQCQGDYVSCMNAGDCYYDNETLENVFTRNYTSDVIYGDCLLVNDKECTLKSYRNGIDMYYFYKDNICHQATFVKLSLMQTHQFNEEYKIAADYALWLQLISENRSFEYVNMTICRYDVTGISSQSSNYKQHKQERDIIQKALVPKLTLDYLEKCEEYENLNDFKSFRNIQIQGGKTYRCLLYFFKLVDVVTVLKSYIR